MDPTADTTATTRLPEETLSLLQHHEAQVLPRSGHSQADVARRSGTSTRAIRNIEDEARVTHAEDVLERHERGIGRPSKAEPYRDLVKRILAEDRVLATVEPLRRAPRSTVLRRARTTGPPALRPQGARSRVA